MALSFIHDTVSGIDAAIEAIQSWPTILKFCGDNGYRGTFVHEVKGRLLMSVEIPKKASLTNGKFCLGDGLSSALSAGSTIPAA